ncbi:hypothetical protein EYF80_017197 [Liparis tanakae]|uniref:Uncharacterized protein n=1 Tax=Liparis tanakae TaxID=230148 RepID=A0A4Z2I441_9TELE|nr:hypothetical protein EYF80_017197 [Liparis tanakae]
MLPSWWSACGATVGGISRLGVVIVTVLPAALRPVSSSSAVVSAISTSQSRAISPPGTPAPAAVSSAAPGFLRHTWPIQFCFTTTAAHRFPAVLPGWFRGTNTPSPDTSASVLSNVVSMGSSSARWRHLASNFLCFFLKYGFTRGILSGSPTIRCSVKSSPSSIFKLKSREIPVGTQSVDFWRMCKVLSMTPFLKARPSWEKGKGKRKM